MSSSTILQFWLNSAQFWLQLSFDYLLITAQFWLQVDYNSVLITWLHTPLLNIVLDPSRTFQTFPQIWRYQIQTTDCAVNSWDRPYRVWPIWKWYWECNRGLWQIHGNPRPGYFIFPFSVLTPVDSETNLRKNKNNKILKIIRKNVIMSFSGLEIQKNS